MSLDLSHILATASFIDADARAECERRVREAVEQEREECAKIVEPKGPRPCGCDYCYCSNIGDAQMCAGWDAEDYAATAIRARQS